MKVSELMAAYTINPDFAGVVQPDDFVLAIDISETKDAEIGDYEVVQEGITAVDASLEPETDEKTYIRQGKVTNKVSTQRTFNITGDRMISAAFQDFVTSHEIKFGTGQTVICPYVFFSIKNGEGEKGKASIITNSDGSGSAGETAEIDVDIMATGIPTKYTHMTV